MEPYETGGENSKKPVPETQKYFPQRHFLDIDKITNLSNLLFFTVISAISHGKDAFLRELHLRNPH
jgi:hypothetical protein